MGLKPGLAKKLFISVIPILPFGKDDEESQRFFLVGVILPNRKDRPDPVFPTARTARETAHANLA